MIKALDHYDPAIRAAAARVIGRLKPAEAGDALLKAVNDSHQDVRFAAMRALGALRDAAAVDPLTKQLAYYQKGEGAWSALDALARIGAAASVPVFTERLDDKDAAMRRAAAEGLGRAGAADAADTLTKTATSDESATVRLAASFALQKLGRNYLTRIVDAMNDSKLLGQADDYLLELGPAIAPELVARLQEPLPAVRQAVADLLGAIGTRGAAGTRGGREGSRPRRRGRRQARRRARPGARARRVILPRRFLTPGRPSRWRAI